MRKFEEVAPVLKNMKEFGWFIPYCEKDPVYKLYSIDTDHGEPLFKPFKMNIQTGWHEEIMWWDHEGLHTVEEGTTEISDDWVDVCYKGGCTCRNGSYLIRAREQRENK